MQVVLRVVRVLDDALAEKEELDGDVDAVIKDEEEHEELPIRLEFRRRRQDPVVLPQVSRDDGIHVGVVEVGAVGGGAAANAVDEVADEAHGAVARGFGIF